MKHSKCLKLLVCLLTFVMLFVSCDGNDPVDTVTTDAITTVADATTAEPTPETPAEVYANLWTYRTESNGVVVRDITIDSGKGGDAVQIVQLSDLHINYFSSKDIEENNAALMSTRQYRTWLAGASSLPNIKRCMELYQDADQIVITGDLIDSLSWGALDVLNRNVFDKYDNVMACLGNHEDARQVQGKVADYSSQASRMEILQENWCNDIYYSSKVIGEKVMLIQMDNGTTGSFWDVQVEKFEKDLATARANGYVVLVFYHIPISTGDMKYYTVQASKVGDTNSVTRNFYNQGVGSYSKGASKEIYDLIVNNGDIIKGTFSGHHHSDYYTEIRAKTASGEDTVIPQYCLMAVPYGSGHALNITVT